MRFNAKGEIDPNGFFVKHSDCAAALTALAAMTAERDGLRDAARSACHMAFSASYLGFDRAWVESQINSIQNQIVREQMQAISMVTAAAKGVE